MSEYIIELPDSGAADEFVAKMGVDDCRIYGYRLNGEIVRCRECKYASAGEAVISGNWRHGNCHNPRYRGSLHVANARADGFCVWGERSES